MSEPSGGGYRTAVGALPVGQLADLAARHRNGVDLRLLPMFRTVGVLRTERSEVDLGAIGAPVDGRMVPVTVCELTSRTSPGRDHEDVRPPGVDVSDAVALVGRPLDDLGFALPRRPVGSGGQVHPGKVRLVGYPARKGDPVAVGRPAGVGGPVFQPRDLGPQALGVHPAHEKLGTLGVTRRREEDAGAVGRPGGGATVHEMSLPGAVGVHHPERRLAGVVDLVDPPLRVHDPRAVRRDLRTRHALHVHVLVKGEALLRGGGGGGERQHYEDRQGGECGPARWGRRGRCDARLDRIVISHRDPP